jgi:catechol 2,3-dioxygenase-like lactoylglutathione lyase family enzyme
MGRTRRPGEALVLQTASLMAFVPVTDLARARDFYVGKLGLELGHADDYGAMLRSTGTTVRLAVVEGYEPPAFTVLGWEVPSIEAAVDALRAQGITMRRYDGMGQDEAGIWRAPSGDRVAWFPDSEGNALSLTQTG